MDREITLGQHTTHLKKYPAPHDLPQLDKGTIEFNPDNLLKYYVQGIWVGETDTHKSFPFLDSIKLKDLKEE